MLQVYKTPERRTQQAQIDDILDEIAAEVEIDSHVPDPVKQIEDRLASLKGQGQGGATAGKWSIMVVSAVE